jgi:ferritin
MLDDRVIDGLKESLAAEFYASICMFTYAYTITGLDEYDEFHEFFGENLKKNRKNMKKCAKQLQGNLIEVQLPAISAEPVSINDSVEDMLKHMYKIATWAVERYTRLTTLCREIGDVPRIKLFMELADSSEKTREAIVKRLGEIPDSGNPPGNESLPGSNVDI